MNIIDKQEACQQGDKADGSVSFHRFSLSVVVVSNELHQGLLQKERMALWRMRVLAIQNDGNETSVESRVRLFFAGGARDDPV